ncbi:MAG TPA: hypothetical protein VLA98_13595, partial [Solirubrobacteraceae bacterium]|nr:hypothetical protein [Solirubrobacteraceae bacterium]
ATGAGRIAHSGGLQLRAGKTKVRLTDFVIRAGKGNTISVKAGKARLNAFSISLAKAKVTRSKPGGFGTTVRGVRVALTAKGAAALNGAFGVHAFAKGTPIGVATVRATPAELAFDGGATALALDPGAASALASLGVAVAPAVPASANADGSIAFPITEGKLNARTLAGSIEHAGGLTLSKGATSVTVRDFVIETAPVAKLTADLGGQRVDLLALDLSQIGTPSLAGGVATVSNVVAKLTDGAAAALNGAFGTTAFAGGLTIGTATVRAESA